jgi:small-conductance mechanosensitive channel
MLQQATRLAMAQEGQVMHKVHAILNAPLFTIGEVTVTTSTLLTALVIVLAAQIVSVLLRAIIRRSLRGRGVRAKGSVGVATRLLHYTILLSGVAMALQTAGVKLGGLFAAGAVFAVGLGFAMQNLAQNFVSGVILLLERSIKPGDILEVEGRVVRVQETGIRSTLVRTRDEEEMIVPNSTLVQATVKNYTLKDALYRLRVVVGVLYGSDMALVRKTLEGVGEKLDWRLQDRACQILMLDFGSSSVDFEFAVWTDDPWLARVHASQLREAIWWAFKQQGITIAFPQLDVHFDPPVNDSLRGLARAA